MSPKKHKRSSILKRNSTALDSPTVTKAKNIRFSTQKFVKEFHDNPDEAMQWGNSYQLDLQATQSSDGSDKTRSSVNSMPTMSTINDHDKENMQISFMGNTSNIQAAEMSMFVRYEEKSRLNDYSRSSFSETGGVGILEVNMSIEGPVAPSSSKSVLSPRKTIYFHEDDNLCVSIQDKVLVTPNKTVDSNIEEQMSLTLMDDELKSYDAGYSKKMSDLEIFDMSIAEKLAEKKIKKPSAFQSLMNNLDKRQTIITEEEMNIEPKDSKIEVIRPVPDFPELKTPPKKESPELYSKIPVLIKTPSLVPILLNQEEVRERDLDLMEFMSSSDVNSHLMTPRRTPKKFMFQEHSLDSPVASTIPIDQLNSKKVIFSASKQCNTVLRLGMNPSTSKLPTKVQESHPSFSSNDSMDLSMMGMPKFESTTIIHPVDRRITDFNRKSMNIADDSDEELYKVPDFKALYQKNIKNEGEAKLFEKKEQRQTVFEASMQHSVDKIKRKSLFDSMDDTTTDLMHKPPKIETRKTVFEGSMNDTMPEAAPSKPKVVKRQTMLDGSINETNVSVKLPEVNETCLDEPRSQRLTVFNGSINETGFAPLLISSKPRQTVFDLKMEETFVDSPKKPAEHPKKIVRRQTTYASNMEETFLSSTDFAAADKRQTMFESFINETNVEIEETKTNPGIKKPQEVAKTRETVFEASMSETLDSRKKTVFDEWSGDSDMEDDEIVELKDFKAINESYAKEMDVSHKIQLEHHFKTILTDSKLERFDNLTKRKSVYTPVDMSETFVGVKNAPVAPAVDKSCRKTISLDVSMNESDLTAHFDLKPTYLEDKKITSGYSTALTADAMNLSVRYHPSSSQRQTVVQDVSMNESCNQEATQAPRSRETVFEDNMSTYGFVTNNSVQFEQLKEHEISKVAEISENKRVTTFQDEDMDETEIGNSTEELLQPIIRDVIDNNSRLHANFTFVQPDVSSFRVITPEMESCKKPAEISHIPADCGQNDLSFGLLSRPGSSMMNISCPNLSSKQVSVIKENSRFTQLSTSQALPNVQVKLSDHLRRKSLANFQQMASAATNMQLEDVSSMEELGDTSSIDNFYDNSYFKDYLEITTANMATTPYNEILSDSLASMNITVDNSLVDPRPNTTVSSNNDTMVPPTLQQRFDAHVVQRMKEQMLKNPPETSYEQYLTKMNLPKLQPLPKKSALDLESYRHKIQESMKIAVEIRKNKEMTFESLSKMLPAIPSFAFLHKNLLECMDEQREKEMKDSFVCVAPCFPWAVGFIELLKNKIETEYHDDFYMETCWAHFNRLIKFTHKSLPNFAINFKWRNDQHLESSTIPIYFDYVTLIINPIFRNRKWSRRTELTVREFQGLLNGCDNFTNRCGNSTKLFEFLQWYDKQVKQAISNVKLLYQMVHRNGAVLRDIDGTHFVFHRCFTNNDVVDFKIDLRGVISGVSSLDLSVTGRMNFNYLTKPLPPDYRGIYLIEIILFDAETFLKKFCVN